MNTVRWGILSTADIARKNWKAICHSGNSVVTAVASRDLERSRRFIRECQAAVPFDAPPEALGSYEALMASDAVDAVYIPLPTGLRQEWVLRAAAAGKHVLCEKPCGINAAAVREMTEACRRQGVQFMDGVMFMHNPRLPRMRQVLDDRGSLGQLKRITSAFSFCMGEESYDANIRLNQQLEPAGCLGDLGWYCIRFALWTMRWQMPTDVAGRILAAGGSKHSPSPVPVEFSAELLFEDGVSAAFYCSFRTHSENWVNLSGSKGSMQITGFVHPLSDHEPSFRVNGKEIRVKHCDCPGPHTDSLAPSQQAAMIRNFANQVHSGQLNAEWPDIAVKTQEVLDACLQSARD